MGYVNCLDVNVKRAPLAKQKDLSDRLINLRSVVMFFDIPKRDQDRVWFYDRTCTAKLEKFAFYFIVDNLCIGIVNKFFASRLE